MAADRRLLITPSDEQFTDNVKREQVIMYKEESALKVAVEKRRKSELIKAREAAAERERQDKNIQARRKQATIRAKLEQATKKAEEMTVAKNLETSLEYGHTELRNLSLTQRSKERSIGSADSNSTKKPSARQ